MTTPTMPMTAMANDSHRSVRPIWQSKTFWLNVISILVASLLALEPDMIPLDPRWLAWIISVLNILLRFITDGRITLTGQ